MKALLTIATVADFALAALLIGVSGFLFGSGPESMHGGGLALAGYIAAVIACIAAPFVGFAFNRRGRSGLGLTIAWLPPAGFAVALAVPPPY